MVQRVNRALPKTLPPPERELVSQRAVKPLQLLPRPPPVSNPGAAESGGASLGMAGAIGIAASPAASPRRAGPPLLVGFVGRVNTGGTSMLAAAGTPLLGQVAVAPVLGEERVLRATAWVRRQAMGEAGTL